VELKTQQTVRNRTVANAINPFIGLKSDLGGQLRMTLDSLELMNDKSLQNMRTLDIISDVRLLNAELGIINKVFNLEGQFAMLKDMVDITKRIVTIMEKKL